MRTAIISDIHGNLEALDSVLEDIDNCQVDSIVCLGDLVGYGPQPEEVIQRIKERKIQCVLGNHDLATFDREELDSFVGLPAHSIELTRKLLSDDSKQYLRSLPVTIMMGDSLFVHGSPPDSVTKYIFEIDHDELTDILRKLSQNVVFVGHVHWRLIILLRGSGLPTKLESWK